MSGRGRLWTMGFLILLGSSVSMGAITALAHYDGNTGNGGLALDQSANPAFNYWFGTGPGSHVVNPAAGQAGFDGALVSTPEAASVYAITDASPASTIFGTSGTIEMWISPNWSGINQGGSGVGAGQMLFGNQYNFFGSGKGLQLFLFNNGWPNNGGQLFAWWVDDGGSITLNNSWRQPSGDPKDGSTEDWVAGQWHHIAFTWTPSQIRLFLDGGIVATSAPLGNQPFQTSFWLAGLNGSMGLNGKMDDLAIWNEVRYTGAFTPPTQPVPEPMSLLLLAVGLLGLKRK